MISILPRSERRRRRCAAGRALRAAPAAVTERPCNATLTSTVVGTARTRRFISVGFFFVRSIDMTGYEPSTGNKPSVFIDGEAGTTGLVTAPGSRRCPRSR